ncbi:MAG: 1-(5-phosphoribosyl)-5-[(5-phosphoribosylamino)methylideneamino]imidazole-4-carboxamide isomerase [Sandaracinaceae bacterium]|jgi:phosphoribosylformimino-5-aminoimidazole carboxamide ribotide isomerase|nr:1-(5-phosphoribosyl)-5-[(5-phosphoribosylamino)methylideneamino]imidazole-4-carboxamide isomerase [Sandaracinaceae bacterium]
MELIPAIDILDGKVVRLHKGDYDTATIYADDPVACAKRFCDAGARRLHVVDLDGARDGKPVNAATIRAIVKSTQLAVQVGGGIRNHDTAARWFDAGVERVVLGTSAVKAPAFVEELCKARPLAVVVAIDARHGEVAVEGWKEGSGMLTADLAQRADAWGAAAILFTAIERDGTREGPDVVATAALQAQLRATVIASGGIGSLDDLRALAKANVRAAVCGRALYSGAFTLDEAYEVLRTC